MIDDDTSPTGRARRPASVTSLAKVRKARLEESREARLERYVRSLSHQELADRLLALADDDHDLATQLEAEANASTRSIDVTVAFLRRVAPMSREDEGYLEVTNETHAALERAQAELPAARFVELVHDLLVASQGASGIFYASNVLELAYSSMRRLGWPNLRCMRWFVEIDLAWGSSTYWPTVEGLEPTFNDWSKLGDELAARYEQGVSDTQRGPLARATVHALWMALRTEDVFDFLVRHAPAAGNWDQAAELLRYRRNEPWCAPAARRVLAAMARTPGEHPEIEEVLRELADSKPAASSKKR